MPVRRNVFERSLLLVVWTVAACDSTELAAPRFEQVTEIGTATSDGFRIGVLLLGPDGKLTEALPRPRADGRWHGADFRTWEWTGWTTPRYHQRLKPVYDSLKAVWSRP